MDKIIIETLTFDTIIGVYAWEKIVKQKMILDLELSCDVRKVSLNDQLTDAVDYTAIANRIIAFTSTQHFNLIETLAERLAQLLLEEFALQEVKLYLRKLGALSQANSAGVVIVRSKQ